MIFLLDALSKSIRKDLGLSNYGLKKGTIAHFLLRNSELFLIETKKNKNLTFTQLEKIEKNMQK